MEDFILEDVESEGFDDEDYYEEELVKTLGKVEKEKVMNDTLRVGNG